MLKLGFNKKWEKLIEQCTGSVSFKVLINGEPSAPFFPQWGIRQGDPLAHYLFLMVQNVLSLNLEKAIVRGLFSGIKIKRNCPWLSYIFFANDSIIFSSVSSHNLSFFIDGVKGI